MGDVFAHPEPLVRSVYGFVAYRIGDGPDAEDVTSETFARALRYRESFDPSRGEALSWLIGIARRCIAAQLAARVDSAAESFDREAAEDPAQQAAERIDLARALASLSDRDRELVALRYGADLTARQIGELLELQTNAVEVALHRALARLREKLDGSDASGRRARLVAERTGN
ncbi:MAG: RNA polymerase sigma factor [Solirubrobacteraceae bacterium]